MQSAADLPRVSVPWRGVAVFALDNLLPVLGFVALVVGAFHLPGIWGVVGGWALAGASAIKVHQLLAPEIETLKAQARADAIERRHARQARELAARQLKVA